MCRDTHLRLNHAVASLSHLSHTVQHIDDALGLRLFQEVIQRYERARPPDPRAAVNDVGARRRIHVVAAEFPVESQQRRRLHRNSVVRPRGEVKMSKCSGKTVLDAHHTTTTIRPHILTLNLYSTLPVVHYNPYLPAFTCCQDHLSLSLPITLIKNLLLFLFISAWYGARFISAWYGARFSDREVVGSIPARGCCAPMPTQRAIPAGSVNEYQRKLGSKRAYHAMH